MESDEFKVEDVHRLVDAALGPGITQVPKPTSTVPLGWYDSVLLVKLSQILPEYVTQTQTQEILQRLRGTLTAGIEFGNIRHLHALVSRCRRCPGLDKPWTPYGNLTDPSILFITGSPPSAVSLATLKKICEQAGLTPDQWALTMLTRCQSQQRRDPQESELENCRPYLHQEITLLQPKLICPLGSLAAQELTAGKITSDHGSIFWLGEWPVMPLYSPEYIQQRKEKEPELLQDLRRAKEFVGLT